MYYHVSNIYHDAGSIVKSGNWGRTVRLFGPDAAVKAVSHVEIILWEVALETARLALAPQHPSRLDCIFAFETVELAMDFQSQYRPDGRIFELEPIGDAMTYRGDFALIARADRKRPYADYMAEVSKAYWTAPTAEQAEILYGGPLRVVRQVEAFDVPLVTPHHVAAG
ncbi:DUF2441 domain-containing protein [Agrobacterium sp.]|uniref:DUF2441 domain-containing protein n=1 Tax=Agrobacterium sp. TaxID=361 RepID=UPI0028AE32FA|nr:DUF2441 domain-containing protein [Agrobacterium sp.]